MTNFERDKKFSVTNFARFVSPALKSAFNVNTIVDSESLSDNLSRCLDREHCIDGYFQRASKFEFFSSRIQRGDYRTFTIRKSRDSGIVTEHERLCRQIDEERIYPRWFIQAYVSDDAATVAIIETKNLLKFIDEGKARTRHTHGERHGQAEFFVAEWDDLKQAEIPVEIFIVTYDGETKKAAR